MSLFSEIQARRATNAKKIAGFGVLTTPTDSGTISVVREGISATIYTIGYERRDGDELMSLLRDQGIRAIADVRERPMSRKPDFRATALRGFCEGAGIEYQPWSMLGSSSEQRDKLMESGDFESFAKQFRAYAIKNMKADLNRLAESVKRMPTALLCYERLHVECHRSIIAELVADELNATIIAIQ